MGFCQHVAYAWINLQVRAVAVTDPGMLGYRLQNDLPDLETVRVSAGEDHLVKQYTCDAGGNYQEAEQGKRTTIPAKDTYPDDSCDQGNQGVLEPVATTAVNMTKAAGTVSQKIWRFFQSMLRLNQ